MDYIHTYDQRLDGAFDSKPGSQAKIRVQPPYQTSSHQAHLPSPAWYDITEGLAISTALPVPPDGTSRFRSPNFTMSHLSWPSDLPLHLPTTLLLPLLHVVLYNHFSRTFWPNSPSPSGLFFASYLIPPSKDHIILYHINLYDSSTAPKHTSAFYRLIPTLEHASSKYIRLVSIFFALSILPRQTCTVCAIPLQLVSVPLIDVLRFIPLTSLVTVSQLPWPLQSR